MLQNITEISLCIVLMTKCEEHSSAELFICRYPFENPNYDQLGRAKRIWYLSPMRAAKVQASLRIRAVSPEPSLLAHTSSESRGTLRQRARSMAPLNGWACAVEICHDGMLEDTNSLDGAQLLIWCSLWSLMGTNWCTLKDVVWSKEFNWVELMLIDELVLTLIFDGY